MLSLEAINTKEGLSKLIETYEGFYQAVFERWQRCQDDSSLVLTPFLLLKRVVSGARGEINPVRDDQTINPLSSDCEPLTREDLLASGCYLPALVFPSPLTMCTRCGNGWTLENVSAIHYNFTSSCDDMKEMYPDPPDNRARIEEFSYIHRACREQQMAETDAQNKHSAMNELVRSLEEAGFQEIQTSWAPIPKRVIDLLNKDNLSKDEFYQPDENESDFDLFVNVQTNQGPFGCVMIDIMGALIVDLTDTGITLQEIEDYESTELFPVVAITDQRTLKRICVLMSRNQT